MPDTKLTEALTSRVHSFIAKLGMTISVTNFLKKFLTHEENIMCAFFLPIDFEVARNALSNTERCFIIGNGPTINKFDLKTLSNEFTIGVNKILYTGFHPSIITISDNICLNEKNMNLIHASESKLVVTPAVMDALKNNKIDKNRIIKTTHLVFPPAIHEYKQIFDEKFDITACMHSVVGDLAIPLAIYLGIKNIFLIGVDSYWAINGDQQCHFYNTEKNYKDVALRNALHGKVEMNMFFAKLELLAQNLGVNIFNISPGSAVQAFPKLDARVIVPDSINVEYQRNIKGDYLVLFDRIFKCIDGLAEGKNSYSFVNIENRRLLRHCKGELITSEQTDADILLNEDSTFFIEQGFTDKNLISLKSVNKNSYVAKHPHFEKYNLQYLNGNFDPVMSSFHIFNTLSEAMLEANAYINKGTKYSFKNLQNLQKLSEEVSQMSIIENNGVKSSPVITDPLKYQENLFLSYDLDYKQAQKVTEQYFLKNNLCKEPMFSEHYIIFAGLSLLTKRAARILEIGTYNGAFTAFLSYLFPESKIVTIDLPSESKIFRSLYGRKDKEVLKKFLQQRKTNLSNANVEFIEIESFLIPSLTFEKFDIIWVDAYHGFPDLCFDIVNAYHLISEKGYILSDDVYIKDGISDDTAAYITLEKLQSYGRLDTKYFLKRMFNPQNADMNKVKYVSISRKP